MGRAGRGSGRNSSCPGCRRDGRRCLPRAPAETSAAMTSAAATEKVPQGNGEIVLVVDDNDQVREVTLKRVESLGYAVLEAKDGPSALRLIESGENVALMLTDIVMPGGMSGYD